MKEQIREKAKDYAKKENGGEWFNEPFPNTELTVGEVCIIDFTAGYEQAVKDNVNNLLIAMLESQLKVEKIRLLIAEQYEVSQTWEYSLKATIHELERQLKELKK